MPHLKANGEAQADATIYLHLGSITAANPVVTPEIRISEIMLEYLTNGACTKLTLWAAPSWMGSRRIRVSFLVGVA